MEEKKENIFITKLKNKYRLVVLNDNSFEEKFSFKLTPLNLFVLVGSVTIFLVVIISSLIAFTPLREYIPGYADVNMRRDLINVLLRTDSLQHELALKSNYIQNINNIINGNIQNPELSHNPLDSVKKPQDSDVKASKEDSLLRKEIESQDQYSLSLGEGYSSKDNINSFFFFTPLTGLISNSFNMADEHYGVDIVCKENEAIKATLDGTVISSNWTLETGYIIQLQHSNNLISVYKHNSALMKKAGQNVKAGEVIAIVGNTGEQTSGPHLHFELWYNGNPIDPRDYMVF